MDALVFESARSLARMIRERQVSSVEVVQAHLDRIEAVNPVLNSVVLVLADSALDRARELDSALSRGEVAGPLHGVPVTIKDAVETAGVTTTGGTLGRSGFVPSADATVVARYKRAGAIVIGKTNMPELSAAGETDNLVFGRTNNPYDPARHPGGSSGGEGAAIASGQSPLGVGSDVGGSIRGPAHFCGIAGIKPTSGRVPGTGHFPSFAGGFSQLWQLGPMARFVEDLTLALPILAGPDGRDPTTVPVPLQRPADVDRAGLRVAYYTALPEVPVTPDVAGAIRSAAAAIAADGTAVAEARPGCLDSIRDQIHAFNAAMSGDRLRRTLEANRTARSHPLLQQAMEFQRENSLSPAELAENLVWIDGFRSRMLAFMDEFDALLCPAHAHPSIGHGLSNTPRYKDGSMYAMVYNVTGWPGAVVRAGTSETGLPIGVQVVAKPWREDIALALARRIEDALGGWQRPPL